MPAPSRFKTLTEIILLSIIISLFPFSSVCAQPSEKIQNIQIVTPAWKKITNEDGTGLYFDIIRRVYQPLGITLDYKIVPWKRAVRMLEYHEADALPGGYYIPSGEGEANFPDYPIGSEVLSVLSKKGTLIQWEGTRSLAGKTLVWIRDYNYHKYLDVDVNWREINAEKQGWRLIDTDRVEFYMENLNILNKYIQEMNVDKSNYDIHVVYTKPLFLRFTNTDKSKKLIEIYDSRMPVMLEDGDIKKLFEKWGFPYAPFIPRSTEPIAFP